MKLSLDEIFVLIAHRMDGCGIRSTARLTGIKRNTVQRHSLAVGDACRKFLDRVFRGLSARRIEIDEAWTYVHTKQRHLKEGNPVEWGDVWLYAALHSTSRAVFSWRVSKRTLRDTALFINDVSARSRVRPHITTDGYGAYYTCLVQAFDGNVDHAVLEKKYRGAFLSNGLRVADVYVDTKRKRRIGAPQLSLASTSYIERFWATLRLRNTKFARSALTYAKSLRHLTADVALALADYNFCRIHAATKMTPAQALGLTDHVWTLTELIETVLGEPEPEPFPVPAWIAELTEPDNTDFAPSGSRKPREITLRQRQLLEAFKRAPQMTVTDLAREAFPEVSSPAKAAVCVQNFLRGLVARGLVRRVSRGVYGVTPLAAAPTTTVSGESTANDTSADHGSEGSTSPEESTSVVREGQSALEEPTQSEGEPTSSSTRRAA